MIKKKSYHTIIRYSFCSFSLIPLLPERILGLPVALFLIAIVLNYKRVLKKCLSYKLLLIVLLPYLFFFISIFYSENFMDAIKKITETRLSLFLLPVCFFVLNDDIKDNLRETWPKVIKGFVVATAILCCIYLIYLPFAPTPGNPSFRFPSGFFFKTSLNNMKIWDLEPVYFSFIIVISIILSSKLFFEQKIKPVVYLIITIILLAPILLLVSKMAIICIGLFVVWSIFHQTKKLRTRIIIFTFLTLLIIPFSQFPSVKYEIKELEYFWTGKKRANDDTGEKRNRITQASFELVKLVNPLFGLGIGDTQPKLNEVFKKRDYHDLLMKKHDAHNQYISMYLGTGLFGLLGLMTYLAFALYASFKNKIFFMSWLVIYFILQMFTETLLERQVPVIIISLVVSVIIFLFNEKPSKTIDV